MAESVKKRSEIEEQDTWKLEDMIESLEKFEELMDGVEERIQEYEAYRGKSWKLRGIPEELSDI